MKQNNVLKIISFKWRHVITQINEQQNVSSHILYARLNSDEYVINGYVDSVDERILRTILNNLNSNKNIVNISCKIRENRFSPQIDFSILRDEIVQTVTISLN